MRLSGAAALAVAGLVACGAALAQDAALLLEPRAERIAKMHAQVGLGIMPERSRRSLVEALREFDAALRAATDGAGTPEARETYLLLGLLWRDFRAWALKPSTPQAARGLEERREELAWVAARGARLVPATGRSAAALQSLAAAGLATQAQRFARECLLRRWSIGVSGSPAERGAGLAAALKRLRESEYNTPRIATELEIAEGQLAFLLQAARALEAGRDAPERQMEFIAKASDHLHEALERAAALYGGVAP